MGGTRSTKPSEVTDYLKKSQGQHQIIFCTYQSTQVLIEALKEEEQGCDLIIFDEAHRTAGRAERAFSLALSDENIKATHRLYLTATPKHVDFQKKSQDGEYKTAFSMDDEAVYGQKVMIDYREAIENDRICDYKVIVAVLKASEIARSDITQSEVFDKNHPDKDFNALTVAHEIALDRVMHSHGVKKIISFHKRIEDARCFAEENSSNIPSSLHCQYIKGTHTRNERADILKGFSDTEYGLLSNARCLTEGINIPSVDCVAFLSPKRSKVDIIQAIGRAMRKDPNNPDKKTGYVLLPLLVEDGVGESEEEAVAATNFDEIWDVLGSLKEFDPILAKVFEQISEDKGANKDSNSFDLLKNHIEIIGTCLSSESLRQEIGTRIIDKLESFWHIRYGELKDFKRKYGHCNVPCRYHENPQLGSWVSHNRKDKKKGRLSDDKITLLDEFEFDWDPLKTLWAKNYVALKDFKEIHGHCNVPAKYPEYPQLGKWASLQRQNKKKGVLSDEKMLFLNELGFDWDPIDALCMKNHEALKDFKKTHGHCNVPEKYPENPQLGKWIGRKRKNKKELRLCDDEIELFDSIGFDWGPLETQWMQKYESIKYFKKTHGHCNVPQVYVDNPELAIWVSTQRKNKKNGRSSDQKIALLDLLGFEWDRFEGKWMQRYDELKDFKKIHGHCNVPAKYPEYPQLGKWASFQRQNKKKGKLSKERIELLESIGFEWTVGVGETEDV